MIIILAIVALFSVIFATTMTVQTTTGDHEFVLEEIINITFTPGDSPDGMIFIEGGTFEMGDQFNEGGDDELPLHEVTLDDFYIGQYEVTQAQFENVMGYNPSYFAGENKPVEYLTWYEMIKFCNKKSMQEGLTPCYSVDGDTDPDNWGNSFDPDCDFDVNGYRLPTEAEWEYAARGGNEGDNDNYRYSGCHDEGDLPDYAWYDSNSGNETHEVGTKLPNQLDIYDMSGNVWEWCWDWYDSDYYSSSPSENPTGPNSGLDSVLRGGYWNGGADGCRVADRYGVAPSGSGGLVGFRILRAYE
ncbi:MAG: SUMF1/EgtB/PvdO family nonheme iron enzyme [Candidatus Cloacimonadota bacterium]|nr:SUMF1/EgtB/PvdO family nonheme iron enzyme [Candidatus Cloacimonadota bacterium]